eukprot:TRINITY_DN48307_c0_g1_i1.p2 TRINITY_DN48307_c0_g1~~TRINITY_DN48307_c0_g1_i1.p2  ORF type:complete len:334 (+),score=52.34 TRINITY_DN48307_c0_g1_i1:100-1101(+)
MRARAGAMPTSKRLCTASKAKRPTKATSSLKALPKDSCKRRHGPGRAGRGCDAARGSRDGAANVELRRGRGLGKRASGKASTPQRVEAQLDVVPEPRSGAVVVRCAQRGKRRVDSAGANAKVHARPGAWTASKTAPPALLAVNSSDAGCLFEHAKCNVCHEVLHNATSIQPCLHSFCSHCLGTWLCGRGPGVTRCPTCRAQIVRVSRNFQLDNLVSALLQLYPGRKRTELDITEIDANDPLRHAGYDLLRLFPENVHGERGAPGGARVTGSVIEQINAIEDIEGAARSAAAQLQGVLATLEEHRAIAIARLELGLTDPETEEQQWRLPTTAGA